MKRVGMIHASQAVVRELNPQRIPAKEFNGEQGVPQRTLQRARSLSAYAADSSLDGCSDAIGPRCGIRCRRAPYSSATAALPPSYRTGRPPPLPGSYVPGAYGPVLLSPGVVPISGWSPYAGPISPVLSPSAPHSVGAGSPYGVTQLPSSASAFMGPYPTFPSPAGPSSSTRERGFPERPGQPDCQYYLKTGDCKFGSSCRFHHPPDWVVSKTNCLLSPMGLPIGPGVQPCAFYMQNGHCKFGSTCRFDHPIRTVRYSPSASSISLSLRP
ncbi:zinc finger CCCH domain-containing protein 32-like [Camellia sinensis]|uniref:zinc finger CCCH domain-containing protein 32-like n=1 Tax=Camellia sinensis TaxID=4442 RepID=UPI001035A598|nr:zinc finger CCCH domain-containing protein 32-like [Camellia sinensis]